MIVVRIHQYIRKINCWFSVKGQKKKKCNRLPAQSYDLTIHEMSERRRQNFYFLCKVVAITLCDLSSFYLNKEK